MQILINTDQSVDNYAALSTHVTNVVNSALKKFSAHITRVEVHFADEDGAKHGPDDKRCLIEARIEGRPPLAATHHASTLDAAVHGAAAALAKVIEGVLGRAA